MAPAPQEPPEVPALGAIALQSPDIVWVGISSVPGLSMKYVCLVQDEPGLCIATDSGFRDTIALDRSRDVVVRITDDVTTASSDWDAQLILSPAELSDALNIELQADGSLAASAASLADFDTGRGPDPVAP